MIILLHWKLFQENKKGKTITKHKLQFINNNIYLKNIEVIPKINIQIKEVKNCI